MKRKLFVCFVGILLTFSLLASGAAQKVVTVELKNAQGESVGTAKISPGSGGVQIVLDLKNLPPGEHDGGVCQLTCVLGRMMKSLLHSGLKVSGKECCVNRLNSLTTSLTAINILMLLHYTQPPKLDAYACEMANES